MEVHYGLFVLEMERLAFIDRLQSYLKNAGKSDENDQ